MYVIESLCHCVEPMYLKNKMTTRDPWFLDFYLSLHFVKMFEYIKSYLKMSN